jgi:hypothetical protein
LEDSVGSEVVESGVSVLGNILVESLDVVIGRGENNDVRNSRSESRRVESSSSIIWGVGGSPVDVVDSSSSNVGWESCSGDMFEVDIVRVGDASSVVEFSDNKYGSSGNVNVSIGDASKDSRVGGDVESNLVGGGGRSKGVESSETW